MEAHAPQGNETVAWEMISELAVQELEWVGRGMLVFFAGVFAGQRDLAPAIWSALSTAGLTVYL